VGARPAGICQGVVGDGNLRNALLLYKLLDYIESLLCILADPADSLKVSLAAEGGSLGAMNKYPYDEGNLVRHI
jgi:hypothetical protein